jgi:hypothetical protein
MNIEDAKILSHAQVESVLSTGFAHGKNILIIGSHGTGKTSLIKKAAEAAGLEIGRSFVYLSGSTLDPWVDFVGVPRPDSNGDYLKFHRPSYMNPEHLELLVIDEINRSHSKVRNACMELAQFKTVNGVPFPKLRAVWACGNPADAERGYTDVEQMDAALVDRFHLCFRIMDEPDIGYFQKVFGHDTALSAIEWWKSLSAASKKKVSPRRLEFAVNAVSLGVAAELSLPGIIEAEYLGNFLSGEDPIRMLRSAISERDAPVLSDLVSSPSVQPSLAKMCANDPQSVESMLGILPLESAVALSCSSEPIRRQVGIIYSEWWSRAKQDTKTPATSSVAIIHAIASIDRNEINAWARKLVSMTEPGAKMIFGDSMTSAVFGHAFMQRYREIPTSIHNWVSPYIMSDLDDDVRKEMRLIEAEARKTSLKSSYDRDPSVPEKLIYLATEKPQLVIQNAKLLRRALSIWAIPQLENNGAFCRIELQDRRVMRKHIPETAVDAMDF